MGSPENSRDFHLPFMLPEVKAVTLTETNCSNLREIHSTTSAPNNTDTYRYFCSNELSGAQRFFFFLIEISVQYDHLKLHSSFFFLSYYQIILLICRKAAREGSSNTNQLSLINLFQNVQVFHLSPFQPVNDFKFQVKAIYNCSLTTLQKCIVRLNITDILFNRNRSKYSPLHGSYEWRGRPDLPEHSYSEMTLPCRMKTSKKLESKALFYEEEELLLHKSDSSPEHADVKMSQTCSHGEQCFFLSI